MKTVALATLEVYYHNVAKYKMEDAEGILFGKDDISGLNIVEL